MVLTQLETDIAQRRKSAELTQEGLTHEEARPENDKDTRALEQSYLARGQAQRVEELEDAAATLRFMTLADFSDGKAIDMSALVHVVVDDEERAFFIVPVAGGVDVVVEGTKVQLITPASPVGRALLERYEGEELEIRLGERLREFEIVAVK
ncbi:MAG: GreA/GreB family elongation factor [Polyangiales bacterium]